MSLRSHSITRMFMASVLFAGAVLGFVFFQGTDAGAASAPVATAVQNLQACIAQNHEVEFVALVDTSGSLHQSDPRNSRVVALQESIEQLGSIASSEGVTVEITLLGFSNDVQIVAPWTTLNERSTSSLIRKAAEFRGLNNGPTTNFPIALTTALSQLQHNATTAPNICRAVLWFTDGAIDLGGGVATAAAVAQMCRPGGPPDLLASNNVFTFAIGLSSPGGMSSGGQRQLKSYAIGGANDVTSSCGRSISTQSGAFFAVSDPPLLLFALTSILNPAIPGVPSKVVECASTATNCPADRQVWVDEGLSAFHVAADTDSQSGTLILRLKGPGGTVDVDANHPVINYGGLSIATKSYSPGSLDVTASLSDLSSARGQWSLTFVAPKGTQPRSVYYAVNFLSNLTPHVVSGTPLVRRPQADQASIGLVNSSNGATVAGVRTLGMTASVSGAGATANRQSTSLTLTPSSDGRYGFTFVNNLPYPTLQIAMSGDLVLGPQNELVPISGLQSVEAPLPADYPLVRLVNDQLPSLLPNTKTFGHIEVTGSSVPGCFYVVGVHNIVAQPLQVHSAIVPDPSSVATCLRVTPGQTTRVEVTSTMVTVASGFVSQSVTVMVRGNPNNQFQPVTLHMSFVAVKPLNVGKSVVVLLALLLLGALLLLVVGALINKFTGRFQPSPQELRAKTYLVAFSDESVGFFQPGQPDSPADVAQPSVENLVGSGFPDPVNEFSFDGYRFHAGYGNGFSEIVRTFVDGLSGTISDVNGGAFVFGSLRGSTAVYGPGPQKMPSLAIPGLWAFRVTGVAKSETSDLDADVAQSRTVSGELTVFLVSGTASRLMQPLVNSAFRQLSARITDFDRLPEGSVGSDQSVVSPDQTSLTGDSGEMDF